MSAAQKALDALDKAERRACGRSACVGDGLDGMCDRCVVRNNLAVNLASPLAAVARAAMERPWTKVVDDDGGERWIKCRICFAALESDRGHNRGCPMSPLDDALDALEAAAAAQGFAPAQKADYGPPDAAAATLLGQIAGASVAVDRTKGGAT